MKYVILTQTPGQHGQDEHNFGSRAAAEKFAKAWRKRNPVRGSLRFFEAGELERIRRAESEDRRYRADHPEEFS